MNRHRNLSFYIESLVLLFFLLAALTVLLRVFGAAQVLGMQARRKTDAALILQSVSAEFSARDELFEDAIVQAAADGLSRVEFQCDSQGNAAQDGDYRVVAQLWAEQRAAGSMVMADIQVVLSSDAEDTPLGELQTAIYCPQMTQEVQP